MRAVLVHPVGAGDLDLDILNYPHAERGGRQTVETNKLAGLVERSGARELFDAFFWKGPSKRCPESERRFPASPLRQIFEALAVEDRIDHVVIVLCGSATGRIAEGGTTDFPALVLEKALECEGVGSLIEDEFRFTVELLPLYDLNLLEEGTALRLEDHLRKVCGIDANDKDEIVVNGIDGPSMILAAVMGVVDRIGRPWRLATYAGSNGVPAYLTTWSYDDLNQAEHLLLALGYVDEARRLQGNAVPGTLGDPEIVELGTTLDRYAKEPGRLTESDMARLLRLDLARGDIAAGLMARTWVRKHYETLVEAEREVAGESSSSGSDGDCDETLRKSASDEERGGELGKCIAKAQKCVDRIGGQARRSTRWLARTGWINDIGKAAVHSLASPTVSEYEQLWNYKDLAGGLPRQIQGPHSGPVLHIVPIGACVRTPTPLERILARSPHPQLVRSTPGGMLDGGELDGEFLLLHSADERSKQAAAATAASAAACAPDAGWVQSCHEVVDAANYGEGNEKVDSEVIGGRVRAIIANYLGVTHPRAVVVTATGQKAAFLAALHAARAWCDQRGVPLFLQSFVDPGGGIGQPGPQFHRIAVGERTRRALLDAARVSLGRLDLATAARTLAAAGPEAEKHSATCEKLRDELGDAATAENMDEYAKVFVDFLSVLIDRFSGENAADPRIPVMVAELFKHATGQKGKFIPSPGTGALSKKNRTDPVCFTDLEAGDCIRLLVGVRDNLIVTHGERTVSVALCQTLTDHHVESCKTVEYADLIQALKKHLEVKMNPDPSAKCVSGPELPPQAVADWKTRFDGVWAFCGESKDQKGPQ